MTALADKILRKAPGICLYGITPPKRTIADEALQRLVEAQLARISALPVDGLVVYDIEDESSRTDAPRPFPFLPTIDAATYADSMLRDLGVPKVIYRPVARFDTATFESTMRAEAERADERLTVLVGAPSRAAASAGISLGDAYRMAQDLAPSLLMGGIAIAERHARGFVPRSVTLAIRIGEELVEYAREHGIPLGINVESVSVRKAEIDASVALFNTLATRVKRFGSQ